MIPITPVQNVEGIWCFTSRGVTTWDLWVRHGTTWWTTSCWIETLPRVKRVPTFKVECRRPGYVDDPTRRTHGKCYDERILEWCLGFSSQTRRKEYSILQMDMQNKACSWQKYWERSVSRGFSQKEGINYEETFSPVAQYTSIRAIMALASMMKWDLH